MRLLHIAFYTCLTLILLAFLGMGYTPLILASPSPATDSTPLPLGVTVTPTANAQIALDAYISTNPFWCMRHPEMATLEGFNSYYCYAAKNTGAVTLTTHSLVDTQLGNLFSQQPYVLAPGRTLYSNQITESMGISTTMDITNTAIWTATNGSVSTSASDSATLRMLSKEGAVCSSPYRQITYPPYRITDTITLTQTGLISDLDIWLDYTDFQIGDATITLSKDHEIIALLDNPRGGGCGGFGIHNFFDDEGTGGDTNSCQNSGPAYPIGVRLTPKQPLSHFDNVLSAGTWEIGIEVQEPILLEQGAPRGYLDNWCLFPAIVEPTIDLTKTVGTASAECPTTDTIAVAPGTEVYHCYTVENTGATTFTVHTLNDSRLGKILLDNPYTLAPGATANTVELGLILSETITTTIVNSGTWQVGIPARDDYTVTTKPTDKDFIDISGSGTPLNLNYGDTATVIADFPITLYDVTSSTVRVGNSGALAVGTTTTEIYPSNERLPTPSWSAPAAAIYWDELAIDGNVYYDTVGIAPNRIFIVQWNQNHLYWFNSDLINVQAQFYENSDTIRFIYLDTIFGDLWLDHGNLATVGLQSSHHSAIPYSYNAPVIQAPLTLEFTPVLPITYLVSASDHSTVTVQGPTPTPTPTHTPMPPPVPEIHVTPSTFTVIHNEPPQVTTDTLMIENQGEAVLTWAIVVEEGEAEKGQQGCTVPLEMAWLSVQPTSGSTTAGGSSPVTLTFDSTGMMAGTYTGTLCLNNNDPNRPLLPIPVSLEVEAPTAIGMTTLSNHASLPVVELAMMGILLLTGLVVFRRR